MENVMEMQQLEEKKSSRRSALLMGGAALAGLALSRNANAQAAAITDTDILNFALNLEYLEATFYSLAVNGTILDTSLTGGKASGTVAYKSTSTKVDFSSNPVLASYAAETANDELNHVKFLSSALGSSAVTMPNIDLMNSFYALGSLVGAPMFDPFADINSFLLGAFIFEDVGVTAYQGAAPSISNLTYLDKALGIHAVEAYHAGAIRTQIFAAGGSLQATSQQIAAVRAKLDGSNPNATVGVGDDIGVGSMTYTTIPGVGSTVVDVNAKTGLTNVRTPAQVLNIVYGNATATPGLFFPQGMNGTIK